MGIFKRNFCKLNDVELDIYNSYNDLNKQYSLNRIRAFSATELEKISILENKHPFILNYDSLFPNNFLNEVDLKINHLSYKSKLEEFIKLIKNNVGEREILKFIKDKESHFIIGSVLQKYTLYGHHDRYIFQEFPLPPNYQADFLIVGKNSMGFHYLFIELESPTGSITIRDGEFGDTIRKGINQIKDWKHWLEKNFSHLTNVFNKYKNDRENLPPEFSQYDSTRIEYMVIAGKREDFNDKSYRLRRESFKEGLKILHYDNIIDESQKLLKSFSY